MTSPSNATPIPETGAIEAALRQAFAPLRLQVLDETASHAGHAGAHPSGRGSHFRVRIASDKFNGLSRVAAHRLVYDALQPFIDAGLHALAIEIER